MILTCPECATSYFVDDSRIPKSGRTVKCTSCGARWTATLEPEAPPPPVAEPTVEAHVAPAEPEKKIAVAPSPFTPPPARRLAPRKEARGKVMIWAVSAGVIVALIAAALLFRQQIVQLWPASGSAFAGVGLPVNRLGLVIEGIKGVPTFEGGRPVLAVTGSVRNTRDVAVTSPALRLSLLDRAARPVSAKIVRPTDPSIPAHGTRHFAVTILDPPVSVHDLEVTFDAAAPAAAAPPPVRAALSPEVEEAKPLPADAPEALHPHE